MEHRQHYRAKQNNAEVFVSDKAGFCTGTLKNFSRTGLCITDLPRRIRPKDGFFTVVVSRGAMKFNLRVQEKWKAENGLTSEVGTAIDNAPLAWTSMVMRHEPRFSDNWTVGH